MRFTKPLLVAIVLLAPVTLAAAGGSFEVRPVPQWVDTLAFDPAITVPKSDVRWGVYALVDDHQVRTDGSSTSDFSRRVRKIVSAAGVQNSSELSFDFDPSYQKLVLHEITRIRDGQRTNELTASKIRVLEKEDESGDGIYDGMLTAVAFLDDVRPGDIVDYSWSLEGANPLLRGKYADTFDITSPVPARVIRHRLLFPSNRPLQYRTITTGSNRQDQPRITKRGDETEYVWERRDVAPLDVEDAIPAWFDPYDHVAVGEFRSWNEVARWADPLFRLDDESREAIRDLAARFRSEHSSRDDQIVAAIRFVQDEIRYLGIEMGRNSHEPHQPAEVLEQRWGDCKDKSFLLAALLRELGVDDARPAMVNTKLRHKLDDQLPSPFMFDHVIVQVKDRGKEHWIDATLSDQGGTLGTIETPNDERALVVDAAAASLAKIVTNEKGATVIDQTYTTRDWDAPSTLVVRSAYSGGDADALRASLATMSSADLARDRLNRYAALHPRIVTESSPVVADDRSRNVIVITDRYSIRDLWRTGKFSYVPSAIQDRLKRPETMVRTMPLEFDYPLDLTVKATFNVPGGIDVDEKNGSVTDPAFRYDFATENKAKVIRITHRLRATSDSVAVASVPDHLVRVNEISEEITSTLERGHGSLISFRTASAATPFALLIVVAALIATFFVGYRFRN